MSKFVRSVIYIFCLINFIFIIFSFTPVKTGRFLPLVNPIINASTISLKEGDEITENEIIETDTKIYNILLLGLDGRRGDSNARCDAIHIFSFSPSSDQLVITSIPRGTAINLPNVSTQSAYLSNNCHINGIEDTISKIEKITNLKIDAYTTVGFSQVLGILRTLDIPTTQTLQFLRNRRYAIGDNQRSHNQAIFLKDMLLSYFDYFYRLPKNFRHTVYRLTDTNLDYNTADYLIEEFAKQKSYLDSDKIILVTKPERNKYVKESHYNFSENTDENQQSDAEFIAYQKQIETYLNNIAVQASLKLIVNKSSAYNLLKIPFKQKLWLQIEDEEIRDNIQFKLLKLYLESTSEKQEQQTVLEDYFEELELFDKKIYLEKIPELEQIINGDYGETLN